MIRRTLCFRPDILIDVGAGRGDKVAALQARFKIAVEPHMPFARMIKARGVDVVCAVAEYLPFRSGVADVVLFWNVIMFVVDRDRALDEIRRVAKPNAYVYIAYFDVATGNHRLSYSEFLQCCRRVGTILVTRRSTDSYQALVTKS